MLVDCILQEKKRKRAYNCEEWVHMEVQSLDKYLSESKEWVLKFVAGEKGLSEVQDLDTLKKHLTEEKTSQWLEKPLCGRFLKDTEKVSTERTWQWLKGDILRKRLRQWCLWSRFITNV